MTSPREEVVEYDGIMVAEVWGVPSDDLPKWATVRWGLALDSGYRGMHRYSVHPTEEGHALFESWRTEPQDAGQQRWFGGAWG